jgi:hypothetical protein
VAQHESSEQLCPRRAIPRVIPPSSAILDHQRMPHCHGRSVRRRAREFSHGGRRRIFLSSLFSLRVFVSGRYGFSAYRYNRGKGLRWLLIYAEAPGFGGKGRSEARELRTSLVAHVQRGRRTRHRGPTGQRRHTHAHYAEQIGGRLEQGSHRLVLLVREPRANKNMCAWTRWMTRGPTGQGVRAQGEMVWRGRVVIGPEWGFDPGSGRSSFFSFFFFPNFSLNSNSIFELS